MFVQGKLIGDPVYSVAVRGDVPARFHEPEHLDVDNGPQGLNGQFRDLLVTGAADIGDDKNDVGPDFVPQDFRVGFDVGK